MAQIDMWEWRQTVNQTLPTANTPEPLVCIDSNPGDNQDCVNANANNPAGMPYMVRITWNDPVQAGGTQQLTTFFIR